MSGEASFEDLASKYSDCSSAKRGGDLGPFGHGEMQVRVTGNPKKKNLNTVFKLLLYSGHCRDYTYGAFINTVGAQIWNAFGFRMVYSRLVRVRTIQNPNHG